MSEHSEHKKAKKLAQLLKNRKVQNIQKQQEALSAERRTQIKSGDRSEKIRTYNFPQNRVTDHRIGFTLHQLDMVMDGRIGPLIDALVTHYEAERLQHELAEA